MLLNSVLLILQETLEAALLVSVLLSVSYRLSRGHGTILIGFAIGIAGACLYGLEMGTVSEWFDYTGQEVVNALMQFTLLLLIAPYAYLLFTARHPDRGKRLIYAICVVGMITAAVTREGSEILLYLSGFISQRAELPAVAAGSAIGFGIGCSVGILLYYALAQLADRVAFPATIALLALFGGNMGAQAILQLTQADWITTVEPLWDSSAWLPEDTMTGQLLYALAGYEATPSIAQVASYLGGALLVIVAALAGAWSRSWTPRHATGDAG